MTNSRDTLFVVGDSISMHYGPCLERFCADRFVYARKTGGEPFLRPHDERDPNGGDSKRVRSYLASWARALVSEGALSPEAPRPDVLLINCGLHDLKIDPSSKTHQIETDAYRENLTEIVRLADTIADTTIWIRTTPVVDALHNREGMGFHRRSEDVAAYNDIADAIMNDAGVPMIDLYRFTRSIPESGAKDTDDASAAFHRVEELFIDHVHFIEPVRALQAAFIAGWVRSAGRLQDDASL